jgi:uncharacterized membrane protein
MYGGQVVEMVAFFATLAWLGYFYVGKTTGRETRGWKWIILQPLVWAIIALVIFVLQQYILPRHHDRNRLY